MPTTESETRRGNKKVVLNSDEVMKLMTSVCSKTWKFASHIFQKDHKNESDHRTLPPGSEPGSRALLGDKLTN